MALTQQRKGEDNDDGTKKSSSTIGSFPAVNNQQPPKQSPKKNSITNQTLTSSSPTAQSLGQTIYNVDNIHKYSNTDEKVEPVEKKEVEIVLKAMKPRGGWIGVDLIPSKNRETEEPYVLEVNSNPGLTGIEKTNKNITEEVFTHFKNRENWRKQ